MRVGVREAASAFLLVHNHPSGDPAPSEEDINFTQALARAGSVVGVPLLDHIIVARQRTRSMLELGVLR
jgi:DNA repair protein RadC